MNDKMPVCVGDRAADFAKKRQPFDDGKLMRVAVLVDRKSFDVLHHEIRKAILCRPAVEQPRNVRVVEARENLPLVAEVPQDGICVHATLYQLDGNPLLVFIIGAFGQENRAHPPAPDLTDNAIAIDDLARRETIGAFGGKEAIRFIEKSLAVRVKQRFHLGA